MPQIPKLMLKDALPELTKELEDLLKKAGHDQYIPQLDELYIISRCGCKQSDCATFYTKGGSSPLSKGEQADRGKYLDDAIDLDASDGLIVMEIDHLERIKGIEILGRPDVYAELGRFFPPGSK